MKKCRTTKIFIIGIFLLLILSTEVSALSGWMQEAEDFVAHGDSSTSIVATTDTSKLKQASSDIFNVFLAVGTAVAVIVGAILGIQFMTAGIDRKVEIKQALFPYVISCIVLFGAFGIWKLVITIMNEIT